MFICLLRDESRGGGRSETLGLTSGDVVALSRGHGAACSVSAYSGVFPCWAGNVTACTAARRDQPGSAFPDLKKHRHPAASRPPPPPPAADVASCSTA